MAVRLSSQYELIPFLNYRTDTAVVTTISAQILGCDQQRVGVIFSNNGANNIFLHPRGPNPPLSGIKLPPDSGPVHYWFSDTGILTGEPWNAVSQTGNSALFIVEILYFPRNQRIITDLRAQPNGNGRA